MIRALVVDDEELPRMQLRNMLREHSGLEVSEAEDGLAALDQIAERRPDVLFLDIEMPTVSGLEVARQLVNPPLIVFATAYDEYAVSAFDAAAIDYLLKPVQPLRLSRTLERIRTALANPSAIYAGALRTALNELRHGAPVRLAGRRNKRTVLISIRQILWIGVEDRLVFLHTATERFLSDRSIGELEQLLEGCGFIRINRSELVNIEHVREVAQWTSGTLLLSLTGATELHVSRDRVKTFKAIAGVS